MHINKIAVVVGVMMLVAAGLVASQQFGGLSNGSLRGDVTTMSSSFTQAVCGGANGVCGGTCGTPGWSCNWNNAANACVCSDQTPSLSSSFGPHEYWTPSCPATNGIATYCVLVGNTIPVGSFSPGGSYYDGQANCLAHLPVACPTASTSSSGTKGCKVDSDCTTAGEACIGGVCKSVGECKNDIECPNPEVCIQGTCTTSAFTGSNSSASSSGCTYDEQCPAGNACVQGQCEPVPPGTAGVECTKNSDCTTGDKVYCITATCVECGSDLDCSVNKTCKSNICGDWSFLNSSGAP